MKHIMIRFALHFVSAAFLILVSSAVLSWIWRRLGWSVKTRAQLIAFLVVIAVPAGALPGLREAFDVAAGQSLIKAVMDYASWFSGTSFASWLVYRLRRGGF